MFLFAAEPLTRSCSNGLHSLGFWDCCNVAGGWPDFEWPSFSLSSRRDAAKSSLARYDRSEARYNSRSLVTLTVDIPTKEAGIYLLKSSMIGGSVAVG
jgi:hypothetical protein